MTKDELLIHLRSFEGDIGDLEFAHTQADLGLLDYINDPEITEAFHAIDKWYA